MQLLAVAAYAGTFALAAWLGIAKTETLIDSMAQRRHPTNLAARSSYVATTSMVLGVAWIAVLIAAVVVTVGFI